MNGNLENLSECIMCRGKNILSICSIAHVYRCDSCGLYFNNPRPSQKSISEYYSKGDKYEHWIEHLGPRQKLWKRRLKIVRKYATGGDLLDVGAGIGQFLSLARSYYNIAGTEVSHSAMEICRQKYGIELKKGSIDQVKFENPFDVITLFHVYEHVPFPGETLDICHKLLKPSGVLIIAVPNDLEARGVKKHIQRFSHKVAAGEMSHLGLEPIELDRPDNEVHLSHFSQNTLVRYFTSNGFDIEFCGLDPYFVYTRPKHFRHFLFYQFSRIYHFITRNNIYDTILVIARKKA